jgi:hypothetical protein
MFSQSTSHRRSIDATTKPVASTSSHMTLPPLSMPYYPTRFAKTAAGIAALYTKGMHTLTTLRTSGSSVYDAQGIAIVELFHEELMTTGIADCFFNHCQYGVTLFFYQANFTKHPPLRYMLEQKVKSLARAALALFSENHEQDTQYITSLWNGIEASLLRALNNHQTWLKPTAFHHQAKKLMAQLTGEALIALHRYYTPRLSEKNFRKFATEIIQYSIHYRSSNTNTLTFNEATQTFSYDEVISTVTAHDRTLGKGCANLSLTCDGTYQIGSHTTQAIINNFTMKHASLVPIDAITRTRLADLGENRLDILLDTCNQIEEVAIAMAKWRIHNGNQDNPLVIDWTYQLLTTNAFNIEKQAITYGYLIQAAHLMNHAMLHVDGREVRLIFNVFNAGINRLAEWNIGQKAGTQRRENRRTFIHLTNNTKKLATTVLLDDIAEIKALKDVYAALDTNELAALQIKYIGKLSDNPLRHCFNILRKNHSQPLQPTTQLAELVKSIKRTYNQLYPITYKIEKKQKKQWNKHKKAIKSAIETLYTSNAIKDLVSQLHQPERANHATQQLTAITALIYKSYMDELYYHDTCRTPQHATLFNNYLAIYQHLTGMMASTGCKSANDRTYVLRIFLAAITNQHRPEQLPPPLHRNPNIYKALAAEISQIAMSHAAMITCINDTAGGTPKADGKKFPYLRDIENIHFTSHFSQFAAHQIQGLINSLKHAHEKIAFGLTDTKSSTLFKSTSAISQTSLHSASTGSLSKKPG